MKSFLVLATTLLVSALALTAYAQAKPGTNSIRPVAGTEWSVVTTSQGCLFYAGMNFGSGGDVAKSITWSGDCQSGQPITGTGILTYVFQDRKAAYSGPVIAGYWHGVMKFRSIAVPHYGGCMEPVSQSCWSTRPTQPAEIKPPRIAPRTQVAVTDIEDCRPQIEEAHRHYVAEQRQFIASYTARAQSAQSAESVKWWEDKRQSSQKNLDRVLQEDPMKQYAFMANDSTRSQVISTTNELETEVRLLREDPGSDQIRNTVGITFTKETAAPRIAFQVARLCTLKVALAQLDRKPSAKAK